MSLKVLNSTFHSQQIRYMRSDSVAASPVSTSIQNLSSNLALQQFSNLSPPSQSISFSYWLSTILNLVGVALMGLMTWNMFRGASPRESSNNLNREGSRSGSTDLNIKGEPMTITVRLDSDGSAASFKKNKRGASVSGPWEQDLTPTKRLLNEYVDQLIDALFHNLETKEREKVLQTLQAHAADPYSDRTTTAMKDLVFSETYRSFSNEQEIITLQYNDQTITCHPFHAQGALLHMLLGILHKNYLLKYPDALYGRHFILDKLLPALKTRVAAMEMETKRAHPSFLQSEIISSDIFDDLQNSNLKPVERIFFKDLYKQQFLLLADPKKVFNDICLKIVELGLDVSEFEVAHPTIKNNKIKISGIREYLSIGDQEIFTRTGFKNKESFLQSQRKLVWALKEAVKAKITETVRA